MKYEVNPQPNAYSKLRQQKLPAWQPILTAGTVVPSFFLVGFVFLPLGIALYVSSERVFEVVTGYTDCKNANVPQLLPAWQPILTAGTVVPSFFLVGFVFLLLGIALYVSSERVFEVVTGYTDCKNANVPQLLPAWQPILTAGTVVPSFFLVGFVFLLLGIALYVSSERVFEVVTGYTDCKNANVPQLLPAWQPILTAGTVVPSFFLVGFVFLLLGIALYVSSERFFEVVTGYTDCKNPNVPQLLPAWQPILTAGTVVPSFFLVGFVFLLLGIALYVSSERVFEVVTGYTDCKNANVPQLLPAWQPILTAGTVVPSFFLVGFVFLLLGIALYVSSKRVFEVVTGYTDCKNANVPQLLPAWQPILTAGTVVPSFFLVGFVFLLLGIALYVSSERVFEVVTGYTDCKNPNVPQLLPAWQPILTAGTVVPSFFLVGFVFLLLGIALYVSSERVFEVVIGYTDCKNANVPQLLPAWQPILTAGTVVPSFFLVGFVFLLLGIALYVSSERFFEVVTGYTDCKNPNVPQLLPAWQPILTAGTVVPSFFLVGFVFLLLGIALYVSSERVFEVVPGYTDCKNANVPQLLPAWQPILTAGTVVPSFFLVGFVFLLLGIALYVSSERVFEVVTGYTDCKNANVPQLLPAWQPILTAGTVVPSFFLVGFVFLLLGIALYVSSERVFEVVTGYTDCKNANVPQLLPAWQPILTAGTVVPSFFLVGFVFLLLGIALYVSSERVFEVVTGYTDCKNSNSVMCKDAVKNETMKAWPSPCVCKLEINITQDLEGDVFFYYGLTNYYQNHRRYVKSRSDLQLLGGLDSSAGCEPFAKVKSKKGTAGPVIAPCGAVANSLFNDTFELRARDSQELVNMTWEGVAWPTDRNNKFANPPGVDSQESLKAAFQKYARPPSWKLPAYSLDNSSLANNGFENADFIVWMRTAALPTFRKLWRKMSQPKLPKGIYTLAINYNYPVDSFDGEKKFIISTTTWTGGKNGFLGVAYIVVGSLCLLLAALFLGIHLKFGKS